ncbi:MAG: FlgD immunoglobulin-like domain containing protein [Ignavibacteriales bacterium]
MIKKLMFFMTILICIFLSFSLHAFAVPAMTTPVEFSQPSGEKFKAAIQGDEFCNWVSTEDGDVLVKDSDKYWKYAEISNGKLKSTEAKYKIQKPKKAKLKHKDVVNAIKQDKILKFNNLNNPDKRKDEKPNTYKAASSTGSATTQTFTSSQDISSTFQATQPEKLLILLVEFTDTKLKYSEADWQNRFFGISGSTVNNYYQEVSNGAFKFLPASETAGTANNGVIKVSLNYAHPNTASTIDSRNQAIVYNALNAANQYIDFGSYDTDHNGILSPRELHIITVVAGYDRSASSNTPSVWGHSWSLYGSYAVTLDGISISKYTQMGENIYTGMSTIGLPCHELGHDMGLPDLYDYTYNSYGLGIHSLMAGGSWNSSGIAPGDSPAHLDAFNKIKIGFFEPTIASSGVFTVNNFSNNQYNILKVLTSDPKQYFLIENRQPFGFDKSLQNYIKKGGLAIYHVDESIANNNNETRKLVDLEEANEGILGYSQLDNCSSYPYDHYFYMEGFSQMTSSTTPNTRLYSGTSSENTFKVTSPSGVSMNVEINAAGLSTLSKLETPQANAIISNNIPITGWVLDPDGVQDILVYMDGKLIGKAVYGDPRPDILAQYPGYKNSNSGFHYNLDTKGITNANHILKLSEITGKGETKDIASINIKVLNGVTISYKISIDSTITIKIFDNLKNLVRIMEKDIAKKAGANSIVWDGKDDSGVVVDNGTYTYNITAKSIYGILSTPATGIIVVGDCPQISSVSDSPDPFDPNTQDTSVITFRLSEKSIVTLQIFDSSGNLVKTLIDNELEAGIKTASWNGNDQNGQCVSNGAYVYYINAVNAEGKKAQQVSGTINIGEELPSLFSLGYNPTTLNPNNSYLHISYVLTKSGRITIDIFDPSSNLLERIDDRTIKAAGQDESTWEGRDSLGVPVKSGTYKFVITLESLSGQKIDTRTVNFSVVSETVLPPTITNAKFEPNPFNPSTSSNGKFTFTLPRIAYVTLQIFNSSNELVRTVADKKQSPIASEIFWDGSDSSGNIVPAGAYTYKIVAADETGLSTSPVTGIITVLGPIIPDEKKPVVSNISASPNPFNPDTNQQSKIQYSISIGAPVKITILNQSGNLVDTLFDGSVNAGINSVVWDGKNSSGTIVSSGQYTCKIQAFDSSGQAASEVSGTILIDKEPPSININDVDPNPFAPIE